MRSMKIATAFLTTALTVGVLASCSSGGGSSDGSVELTFWDGNAIPERTEIWNEIIADFEAENPGITVDYVGLPQDSSGQKFDNAIATDSQPDVGVLPRGDVSSYQAQGGLQPLDDYLADSSISDSVTERYLEQTRGNVPDGMLYAMPTHALLDTIWYRPQLFEAAGLEAPDTWPEFYEAADALTDKSTGQFGFTLRGGEGAGFQMLADIYASSGIDEFFDSSGQATVNDPENVDALENLVELYNVSTPEADVTNTYPKMLAQFQGGQIAMMQHNIGSYPTISQTFDDTQVAPIPLPRSAEGAGRIVLTTLLPSMGIFDDDHADESWEFIEFAMQPENNSKLAEQAAGIPTNIEAQEADWVQTQPAIQMALDVINDPETKFVQTAGYLPEYTGIIRTEIEPMFQKVLLGEATAEELLDLWADELNEAKADYEERNK